MTDTKIEDTKADQDKGIYAEAKLADFAWSPGETPVPTEKADTAAV